MIRPQLAILLLALLLLILPGCRGEGSQHAKTTAQLPTIPVKTMTLALEDVPVLTEVMGTVTAVNRATIAAKVTGTITKLPILLGSRVQKGDLLVKISAEEISAKVIQAQAQLAQAKRTLAKERKLLRKKAATSESVKTLEDMYQVAEAVYREATTMLGYTEIRAPFAGVITRKMANIGDLSTPGTPLLQIEAEGKFQAVTAVPEGLLLRIKVGDELAVTIPSADIKVAGMVAEVAPAIDSQSRTAPIKINLGQDDRLRSGQFARVALPGESSTTSFVPASAVRRFGQMERAFVLQDGRARLRLVRSGSRVGERLEILAGLSPGDQVIINNTALLDGQPVTIDQ